MDTKTLSPEQKMSSLIETISQHSDKEFCEAFRNVARIWNNLPPERAFTATGEWSEIADTLFDTVNVFANEAKARGLDETAILKGI